VAITTGVRSGPRFTAVVAPRGTAAAGLVRPAFDAGMPRERVDVALRARTMILPGGAPVDRAHQPTELDPDEQEVGVVRIGSNPADVRGPRPRRKAPGRPRWQVQQGRELAPAFTGVVAAKEGARLGTRVDGPVNRAHRNREYARSRQLTVDPGATAVARPPYTAVAEAGIDDVGVAWIDRETLRTAAAQ
jgi:hypothetical protein